MVHSAIFDTYSIINIGKYNEQIFDLVMKQLYSKRDEFDYDILSMAVETVSNAKQRNEIEEYIDELIEDDNEFYYDTLIKCKYDLMKKYDSRQACTIYIQMHIDIPIFRDMVINDAVIDGDYDSAIALCQDAEEIYEGKRGVVESYKKRRYEIYKKANYIDNARKLSMEFLMDGDFSYYSELKEFYTVDEWQIEYPDVLDALYQNRHKKSDVYTIVLIVENEKEKLMSFVREKKRLIYRYYKYLLPDYSNEVYEMFYRQILDDARLSSNRNQYKSVCETIKMLIRIGGKEKAEQTVLFIREEYKRKPAFMDEISKINF